jgi:cytoskeletal protein CcmA (bactofilin family)
MFGNKENTKDEIPSTAAPREKKVGSVIGDRVSFNGTLRVEGSITIHGQIEGSIACTGQLVVGKTGRVKADLDVGSASIAGQVEGKVFAKERVELQTDSHLKGDVHAKSFVIQDGCFFQGNCIMGEAHKTSTAEPATVEPSKPEKVA